MPLRNLIRVVVLVIAVGVSAGLWFSSRPDDSTVDDDTFPTTDAADNVIELTPEKLAAAQLKLATVELTDLQSQTVVTGRLKYDDRRHIEIRSATAGIITDIPVKPGDRVSAGDVLVVLNSADVGNARADVLQQTAAVELAAQRREWERQTCDGLTQLTAAIRKRVPPETLREQFRNTTLGKSREQLLTAWSNLLLAEVLLSSAGKGADSGAVPGRLMEERRSTRDQAEATLTAAIEQLTFEATQSCRQADAELADAQQRRLISQQTVATLLGSGHGSPSTLPTGSVPSTTTDMSSAVPKTETDAEPLSVVKLVAPFDGTIERRNLTQSERVNGGDSILVLADTSTLWVAADLRERDWGALALKQGETVSVTTASLAPESRAASIYFTGREVDPQSNAIPLIAIVDNADGRLRPGMSTHITLPAATSHQALTIPETAVMQHDRRTFVFVPVSDDSFRPVDVVTGVSVAGATEVVSGLTPGEQVVSHNAFLLKSELLLQGEDD